MSKKESVYAGDGYDDMDLIQKELMTPEDYRKNLRCKKIYPIHDPIRTIGVVLTPEQAHKLGMALLENVKLDKSIKLTAWKDTRKSDNTHQITLELID